MKHIDRRRLFKLAGAGSAVAAAAGLPIVSSHVAPRTGSEGNLFGFRATLGLPQAPLPSYATYVIEGSLNLIAGTGLITSRVLAGHPGDPSEIGLPGTARVIKVTQITASGTQLDVRGVIEDRAQLQPGESPQVQLTIDQAQKVVRAPFGDRMVTLAVES